MLPAPESLPLLSICIPTWNREAFLKVCLDSVLAELERNPGAPVEVIISDNDSPDGTKVLCAEFLGRHPAFRYSRNHTNIGVLNLPTGVELAQGRYCWFLGDDDALLPGSLRLVLDSLADGRDIYLSWAIETDADLCPIPDPAYWYSEPLTRFDFDLGNEEDCLAYLSKCRFMAGLFAFISILIFRRERWMEQKDLRDTWTWTNYPHQISLLGMTLKPCPFRFLPEPLVYKRLGNDRWAEAAPWQRLFWDIRTWGEFGRVIFGDRPRLKEAFYQVARRNHPEGIISSLRNTQDEKAWKDARHWLLELGYNPAAIASVELGWNLLLQNRRASTHLDAQSLCLADTAIVFRGAWRAAVLCGGGLEDILMQTALLPELRKAWSGEILLVLPVAFQPLFATPPEACRLFPLDEARFSSAEAYRNEQIQAFREYGAETVLNLSVRRLPHLDLLVHAGSDPLASIAFQGHTCPLPPQPKALMDRMYTRLLDEQKVEGMALDVLKAIAELAGAPADLAVPRLWLSSEILDRAKTWFEDRQWDPSKTLVLAPGFIRPIAALAPALASFCKNKDLRILALGSREDRQYCQQLLDEVGVPSENRCGELESADLAAFLSLARLILCGDTDLAHLACAAGVPHLVITSGATFGRVFPYSPLSAVVAMPLECFFCDGSCPYPRMHCIEDMSANLLELALESAWNGPRGEVPTVVLSDCVPNTPGIPKFQDISSLLNASECKVLIAKS